MVGQRGGFEVQNLGGEMNGKVLNNGHFKSHPKMIEKLDKGGGGKAKVEKKEKEVTGFDEKSEENGTATRHRSTQGAVAHGDVEAEDTGSCSVDGPKLVENSNLEVSAKSFVATEICDGKSVNIAEGLKLYEDLFDDSEILKLNNLVNDLRAAGKRGQLQGTDIHLQILIRTLKPIRRGHACRLVAAVHHVA
ncbi:hypothetical protein OROMI_000038 [Orobanche minor]